MVTERTVTEDADADAAMVAGGPRSSSRVPLDRARIVAAALEFIDDKGLPGLTMRRLGAELGVEAMALYRHVPGKEDLLDAVVTSLADRMGEDDEVRLEAQDGWQDFVQRMAHGVRRVALEHPKAFPLIASRPPEAPWLRPPLRSLDWVEAFLSALVEEGFTDEAAVAGYRAFTSFLLGHLLLEASTHGADVGPLDVLDYGAGGAPDQDAHPTVLRLRDGLSQDRAAAEFEEALEELLGRIGLIRTEALEDSAGD